MIIPTAAPRLHRISAVDGCRAPSRAELRDPRSTGPGLRCLLTRLQASWDLSEIRADSNRFFQRISFLRLSLRAQSNPRS
jgi:hypothetical protein